MRKALSKSQLFIKRNAPTILTSIGGVGVVTTAISAAKATPKALLVLEQAKEEKGEDLTMWEKVNVAGPVYIPTVVMGAATLLCIFGANALNKQSQAALSSAYAMANNAYKEYKKKVEELYGENADQEVTKAIAEDKYDGQKPDKNKELFYEAYSGRFFTSTIEEVQNAAYELNRDLVLQDWATLNAYYDYLGLPEIDGGDILGWSTGMNEQMYWQTWIDFSKTKMVDDDGLEYYILRFYQDPMTDFEEFF